MNKLLLHQTKAQLKEYFLLMLLLKSIRCFFCQFPKKLRGYHSVYCLTSKTRFPFLMENVINTGLRSKFLYYIIPKVCLGP